MKSAVLWRAAQADATTVVEEAARTRHNTERGCGFGVTGRGCRQNAVAVAGGQRSTVVSSSCRAISRLRPSGWRPPRRCRLRRGNHNVGLNPTRTALLGILRRGGAVIDEQVEREAGGEPSGRVRVRHGAPRPLRLDSADVPYVIDEIPALAAWASHGGDLHVTGAGELRTKESDRITALVRGFQALGADAEELADGFHIRGSRGSAAARQTRWATTAWPWHSPCGAWDEAPQ